MVVSSQLCDTLCDSFKSQKSDMAQGINGCYFKRHVTVFVTKVPPEIKLPILRYNSITKNPRSSSFLKKKLLRKLVMEHVEKSLMTKEKTCRQAGIKKQPPTARSLSAVCGAPNRIRTCGLLIRSVQFY